MVLILETVCIERFHSSPLFNNNNNKYLFNLLKIHKRNNLTNIYIHSNIEIWQQYTGAVDMQNRTHKHPLKDVIHCGTHMRTATGARLFIIDKAKDACTGFFGRLHWVDE